VLECALRVKVDWDLGLKILLRFWSVGKFYPIPQTNILSPLQIFKKSNFALFIHFGNLSKYSIFELPFIDTQNIFFKNKMEYYKDLCFNTHDACINTNKQYNGLCFDTLKNWVLLGFVCVGYMHVKNSVFFFFN